MRIPVTVACISLVTIGFCQGNAPGPNTTTSLPNRLIISDPTAVEDINAKASYLGGWMDSAEGHNFDASISVPVLPEIGFQADALYSHIGSLDFYGGAGHLFWRDPEIGLLGVAGGYLSRSGVDTFQVGAEAEYYLGRISFGAFVGLGRITYSRPVPFIETQPTRFIGSIRADLYPVDDLRLGACYMSAFNNNLFKGDIEYQTPIAGLALVAEGAIGDYHYDHLLFGLRYYLGENKTLMQRHRQLDPRSLMPQILHSLGLYGAEYNRKGKTYVAQTLGYTPPNFDSYGCVASRNIMQFDPSTFLQLIPPKALLDQIQEIASREFSPPGILLQGDSRTALPAQWEILYGQILRPRINPTFPNTIPEFPR